MQVRFRNVIEQRLQTFLLFFSIRAFSTTSGPEAATKLDVEFLPSRG